jgi:hypothetical protein
VSQGGGGEHPRGEPCGSHLRSLHDRGQLRPGIEALKRRALEPKEGRRETARGHGPGNRYRSGRGHASRGESRERSRQLDPSAGPGWDQAVMWDEPRRRMGSGGKTRFRSAGPLALWRRRTSGEPSREDATREETDGADSQDEPKTTKEAETRQRPRPPPGRVRKTLEGPRKRSGGVRGTIIQTRIGSATARTGRP